MGRRLILNEVASCSLVASVLTQTIRDLIHRASQGFTTPSSSSKVVTAEDSHRTPRDVGD